MSTFWDRIGRVGEPGVSPAMEPAGIESAPNEPVVKSNFDLDGDAVVERLRRDLEERCAEVEELREEVDEADGKVAAWKLELERVERERDEALERLDKHGSEEGLAGLVAEQHAVIEDQQTELEAMEDRLDAMGGEVDGAARLRADLDTARLELSKLNYENYRLRNKAKLDGLGVEDNLGSGDLFSPTEIEEGKGR